MYQPPQANFSGHHSSSHLLCTHLLMPFPLWWHTNACLLSCFSHVLLLDPMDRSLPVMGSSEDSSVHKSLQERILEWVAMPSSRGSSPPRDQTSLVPGSLRPPDLMTTPPQAAVTHLGSTRVWNRSHFSILETAKQNYPFCFLLTENNGCLGAMGLP